MVTIKPFSPKKWKVEGETVVFFLFQDLTPPKWGGDPKEFKTALELAKEEGFQGAPQTVVRIPFQGKSLGPWVTFVGLGSEKEEQHIRSRRFRDGVGELMRKLKLIHPELIFVLPEPKKLEENPARLAQLATEGVLLGLYRFDKYLDSKTKKKLRSYHPKEVLLYLPGTSSRTLYKGIERGKIFSEATIYVRDLVNEGASTVTPAYLAEEAKKLAKKYKEIQVKIWDEKKLVQQNFGGIYAVGRGSANPPRFIRLEYTPRNSHKKTVALVGKGITFDTGGVNLKSTAGIETMKEDMSGAGAILGIFSALPRLQPPVRVIGLIPAAENMVDGFSYKPGDIITTYSGKTIEIINTDAEGRLILADALGFCTKKEKVDEIIDLATLTGACILALGKKYVAAFFTEPALKEKIFKASYRAGERIWELPLDTDYQKDLRSEFASIKNAPAIRQGGTIHGALFLYHFLEDKTIPWAHLDIAPSTWSREYSGVVPYGGTGVCVRTLLEYLSEC